MPTASPPFLTSTTSTQDDMSQPDGTDPMTNDKTTDSGPHFFLSVSRLLPINKGSAGDRAYAAKKNKEESDRISQYLRKVAPEEMVEAMERKMDESERMSLVTGTRQTFTSKPLDPRGHWELVNDVPGESWHAYSANGSFLGVQKCLKSNNFHNTSHDKPGRYTAPSHFMGVPHAGGEVAQESS